MTICFFMYEISTGLQGKCGGEEVRLVRERRLELLRIAPLDPKSSASTSSATLARWESYFDAFKRSCQGLRDLKPLLKLIDEIFDEPLICETVIGIMAYNHMIEHLDHQEL